MKTIYQLDPNHIAQLHALYQQEWWTRGRTQDETKRVVEGSQLCVALVDAKNELLGFARVLTDFTFKALIFDVIVRVDHRKTGLGDKLLALIKSHEKLKGVKHFELYCLPEMFEFYARHGFTTEIGDVRLMRWTPDV